MFFIKPYNLFEFYDPIKKDPLDIILRSIPNLEEDKFTQEILPNIKTLIRSKNRLKIQYAIKTIREVATKKFGGFDKTIPVQEVLERTIDHYIDRPDGILDTRAIEDFIDHINRPVRKSLIKFAKISKEDIDIFTDHFLQKLEEEGIKDDDAKKQLKKIYTWALPIFLHFYNFEQVKDFKYMKDELLFTEDELESYMSSFDHPDTETPTKGGIKSVIHGKKA